MVSPREKYIEKITGKKTEGLQNDSYHTPPEAIKHKSLEAQRVENFLGVSGLSLEEFKSALHELGII